MNLNPQEVNAYKQILLDPAKHGFNFKPLNECFEKSEKATAKHILFEQLIDLIKVPLPKVIFYILMDQMYATSIGKADDGNLGYYLKLS